MYLKLIAEIIAFQSIEIGLSFFLHLLSQYVNSEIWQPVTLHNTENQSKIFVYLMNLQLKLRRNKCQDLTRYKTIGRPGK